MAPFKCKMCGGNLELTSGSSVVTCEYCGAENDIENIEKNEELSSELQQGFEALEKADWDYAKNIFSDELKKDANNTNALLGMLLAEEKCKSRVGSMIDCL